MNYIYTECKLPSNGMFYEKPQVVHIRPKTIFDIKTILNNPVYLLKSEIDALQNCINPKDNINVYDLVNQDVVYLLYMLRSLSDDNLEVVIKDKHYPIKISELNVEYLDKWDNEIELPESKIKVVIAYQPIKNIFSAEQQKQEFLRKYPEYSGDITNTIALLNAVASIDNLTNKDHIRTKLEQLSWKDSIYLINKIEELSKIQFGIKEEVNIDIDGEEVTVPLQITEAFFRPSI